MDYPKKIRDGCFTVRRRVRRPEREWNAGFWLTVMT